MEQVKICINGWRDESIMAKQNVSLVFVPEGSEAEVVEPARLVQYQPEVLPEKLRAVAPSVSGVASIAKVGGQRGVAALPSFLARMADGTYVIAIKRELWDAYRAFIEAGAYVIRKMTEKSVIALLCSISRAFEMAKVFEAEEAEVEKLIYQYN